MSMFRNVKERGVGLFSGHGLQSKVGRGKTSGNRRARVLNLEALENRQLLSVSPGVSPDEACDLGQCLAEAEQYSEPVAIVATMDPTQGADTAVVDALPELELAADSAGVAPALADDAYAMTANQQLGAGVLANDVDADGDELVVSLEADASHGQLTLESNGLFTYRPDIQFGGVDSFTYTVSDGVHEVGPATVTIEVTAVEGHAPEAVEDAYSLQEDEQLTVSRADGLLANDADADGDPLYANLVDAPEHGTLTVGRYGSFTYTPDGDFSGTDQFTYMANDIDGEGGLATVTLTVEAVNDAPVSAEDAYSTAEDEPLTVDATAGVLANDSDADGDALSVSLVDEPSHGTVTVAEDGSFVYTPDPDFHGEDSFTYVASDGQVETEVASVTIMVEAVNDAPTAGEDAYSVAEDNALLVEAGEGVLANDTDVDGDALSVSLVGEPSHGTVTLAEDGSFEYMPEPGFHGEDSFTYVTSDGQSESTETLVAIAVEAINDAPVSAGDAYVVAEDSALTVDAIGGVLANDTDVDGDALTASLVDKPSHGTVTLAADGSFEYTPAADFAGEDSFTYLAGDGQADGELTTVAITVEAMNDAPAPVGDAYTVAEDGLLTVEAIGGVLSNDLDVDGDALSVSLVDEPSYGTVTLGSDGSFEYTPAANFHGEDSFTYMASDGQAESETITVAITVEAVNDVPTPAADAYATDTGGVLTVEAEAGVLANDSDIDGDALSARLVESPANGTVVLGEDGSFEYTPEPGFYGEDSFTYVSADGQAESEATSVSVEVTGAQLSIQLQVSAAPFGTEVDTLWTDSTFWVSAFVEDLRDVPAGVIGGAIDLAYDTADVTPTGDVVYGEAFDLFQQGEVNGEEGLVDEAGALTATAMVGADEAAPFVSWQFTRTGDAINTQFSVDPAEGTSTILPSNFALTDSGVPVEWSNVEMGSAEVGLVFADFNGDQRVDHFDLALWVPHSGTAAGDAGYQPMFDLNSNSTIDQADLDLLTSGMYAATPLSADLAVPSAEEPGSTTGNAMASALADVDSSSERDSEESDPILAVDDLFASEDLWA
jgi:VCBS repeat-containing protein